MSASGLARSAAVLALMIVAVFGAARPTLTTMVSGRVAGGQGGSRAADVLSWALVAVGVVGASGQRRGALGVVVGQFRPSRDQWQDSSALPL
jgi:hypothetical protein